MDRHKKKSYLEKRFADVSIPGALVVAAQGNTHALDDGLLQFAHGVMKGLQRQVFTHQVINRA
jgi:hypothetical protein